jgi:hypothetical protein
MNRSRFASLIVVLAGAMAATAQPPRNQVVVLDDGSLLEGTVQTTEKIVRVAPPSGPARIVTAKQVAFIGDSRSAAYDFVARHVDAKTAIGARQLATWCEKAGLPDKAIVHAKALAALAPMDRAVMDWIARLEKTPAAKELPATAVVPAANVELTGGSGVSFAARIQPILSNQCASCHAAKDHVGAFKLGRIAEGYANTEITAANLKIVAGQLTPDHPTSSPLLRYALAAHGGQKRPSFPNRDVVAFRHLEAWVIESLPKPTESKGFVSAIKPEPKRESSVEPSALPVLPGSVVGELGRTVPSPPAPVVPSTPMKSNARDPFDPATFNRQPKPPSK